MKQSKIKVRDWIDQLMKIIIQDQHLNVNNIDVVAVSSSSSVQIGDNDQVVLYSNTETPPDSLVIGPFPSSPFDTTLNRYLVPLPSIRAKVDQVKV